MMLNADLIIGISSFIVGGAVFAVTRGLSSLGGVFINYLLVVMFFLSAIMFIKGLVKPERLAFFDSAVERNNIITGLIILLLWLVFMPLAGFLPVSYVFYACFNIYLGEDRWSMKNIVQSMGLSAVVVTFFYFMFHNMLQVPLPVGAWFE